MDNGAGGGGPPTQRTADAIRLQQQKNAKAAARAARAARAKQKAQEKFEIPPFKGDDKPHGGGGQQQFRMSNFYVAPIPSFDEL